jgi:hypothetical protein
MDVMNLPDNKNNTFQAILDRLKHDYPNIRFVHDEGFMWQSHSRTIFYDIQADNALWSLIHEVGHAIHNHETFHSDADLIQMELQAWEEAKILAHKYDLVLDPEYVEECLDSYREWQHKRSTCPTCTQHGVEIESRLYHCINCQHRWSVGNNRLCRVYRKDLSSVRA